MGDSENKRLKVIFATPTFTRPHPKYLESLEACLPAVEAAGFDHQAIFEIKCQYISCARGRMLAKAMRAGFDYIVFIDDDVSFTPEAMVKLLKAEGDVVAGTYRMKVPTEAYMACIFTDEDNMHRPQKVREDGAILADRVPAGFLRVSWRGIWRYLHHYPEAICYQYDDIVPFVIDIFKHGAHNGQWWGEDYAFCRNYRAAGGEVWLLPDLDVDHNFGDNCFKGNFKEFLLKQPGGSKSENPVPPLRAVA